MLWCVLFHLCYALLYQDMSSYIMLCYVMLCYMLCYVMPCYVMLCNSSLSPLLSVLNAAARLIARLPRSLRPTSLPSSMTNHRHWLPLIARIQLKVLTLIYLSHIGQAPRYLRDLIRLPSSATSLRPLRSLDRHDLFVPRANVSMAKTGALAIIGPGLGNQLRPSTRSTLLAGEPSASFRSLKIALFSLDLSHSVACRGGATAPGIQPGGASKDPRSE